MGAFRLILGLLAAVAIVSFGVLNMKPVSITYHRIGTVEFPLFYIILGFFVAGFLVAWVGGLIDRLQFYSRYRTQRRQIRMLKKELDNIKQKSSRLLPASVSSGSNGEAARALSSSAPAESSPASGASRQATSSREEGRNVSID